MTGTAPGRGLAEAPRTLAFTVVISGYALGGLAAWAVIAALAGHHHPVTVAFYADLAATLAVFAVSMLIANASLYDPYWSVAPPVIAIGWVGCASTGVGARQLVVVVLILAWAVRLTAHWAGTWHGLGNLLVIGLYGASWYLRRPDPAAPPDLALLLSACGLAVGGLTAWLGGELVDRLGVGVDPGAHLNSPNSLSDRPARA